VLRSKKYIYIQNTGRRTKKSLSRREAGKWHNYLNYEGPCPGRIDDACSSSAGEICKSG